ncbi:MAG: alpha/beta hydrolase [Actinomycetota bacterium]|nr:alpha/beta hydrolase [Actinomycetota bacterium]
MTAAADSPWAGRSVVLVHSPLVGPSTWRRVADELVARGASVAVPDLTAVASAPAPMWPVYVEGAVAAARGLPGPVTVLGHSGAAVFLPIIADRLSIHAGPSVFVDALVPPAFGERRPSDEFLATLDRVADGELLRPWLDWWPADLVETVLLPDPGHRAEVAADLPRLPRRFYDEPVPMPPGWSGAPCAYLRLSEGYDDDHAEAASRGWPTAELDRTHLGIVTDPVGVVDAVGSLLVRLDRLAPLER